MQQEIPEKLKQKYIQLLEKFEVALKIDSFHVIIPSLMPDSAPYPKTNDILSDVTASYPHNFDSYYQPPFRRFWFSNYIPDGFWPRLICRIATDQHIGKVGTSVVIVRGRFSPGGGEEYRHFLIFHQGYIFKNVASHFRW